MSFFPYMPLFVLLFTTFCSSRVTKIEPPPEVNTDHVMRLIGRWGLGHGCPVDGVVLTAGHLVQPDNPQVSNRLVNYAWSNFTGRKGYLAPVAVAMSRDLGKLRVTSGNTAFYTHAKSEPYIGDLIQWVEYDFENSLFPRVRQARIANMVSGHLVVDEPPTRGASGSCVFNAKGEVVAIVTWRIATGGIVVSVSGGWWTEPE